MRKYIIALTVGLFFVATVSGQQTWQIGSVDTTIGQSTWQVNTQPCLSTKDSITTHDTLISTKVAHITAVRSYWVDYDYKCINNFFYFITHRQICSRAPVVRDTIYRDTTYTDTAYLTSTSHDSTYTVQVPCPVTWLGLWGNGDNVTQKGVDALKPLHIKGWRPRFSWKLFEPKQGQFDTGYILSQLRLLANNGLEICPMLFVGDNSPEWIYATVPRVKTTTGQIFPFYIDATYRQYTQTAWAKFLEIIEPYCMGAMCAEGSTGDTGDKGGYKGEPVDSRYAITRTDWTNYRHSVWQYWHLQWNKILCVNPGNNGKDLSYIRDSAAFVQMIKQGNFTHQINMDGDSLQVLNASRTVLAGSNPIQPLYQQQEFEGTDIADTSWKPSLATDITLQNAHYGGSITNVAPSKAGYAGFAFANTYNGTDSMFWYPHIAYQGTIAGRGNWWDDVCDGCILTPYLRGIKIDGGDYGFRDGNGSGLFGRYFWSGTGVVKVDRPCVLRVWYRDGIGTLQVGSHLVQGRGTGKEVYADFVGAGLSVAVNSTLRVFLVEGK